MSIIDEIPGMLRSTDPAVKEYAIDWISRQETVPATLSERLSAFVAAETDDALAAAAVKVMSSRRLAGSLPALVDNFEGFSEAVKITAIDTIAEIGSAIELELLQSDYRKRKEPRVRSKAAGATGKLARRLGVSVPNETAFDMFTDPDARTRANACTVKLEPGNAMLASEYRRLLRDASPRVAAEAAVALYESGDTGALELSLKLIESGADAGKKLSFLHALGRMPSERSAAALRKVLREGGPETKRIAATGLGRLRDEASSKDLIELYIAEIDEAHSDRYSVIPALNEIGAARSAYAVLDALSESREDSRRRATLVKLMAMLAPREVVNSFRQFLEDEDPRVRSNAVEAVGILRERKIIDHQQARELLYMMTCDGSSRVVACSARELFKSGVSGSISILNEMNHSHDENAKSSARHFMGSIPVTV